MKALAWLERRFRMSAEARFRWQVGYRKPVLAILLAGGVLATVGLLWDDPDRWIVLSCGLAAWVGCAFIRMLASDGGRG